MKTEIIPIGTRVRISGDPQTGRIVDTKMSRSGKTRRYCIRGYATMTRWAGKLEREQSASTGEPIRPAQVLTHLWVNDWQIKEVFAD